jgi:hypothetical protein
VQRGDGGSVGVGECLPATQAPGFVGGGVLLALEGLTDATLQLRSGGLGEGDGGQRREVDLVMQDQVDDPADQRGGLAGAGAGLDEQGARQARGGDDVAGGLIDEGAHVCTSSSTRRSRTRSSGAATFASAWSPRSRGHTWSKSQ